jgi:PAS domain S-box-containing protein
LGPAAFFHFAYLYTRRKRGRRSGWVVPLVYAIALGDGLLYLTTDLIIRGVQSESWGWTASPVRGPLSTAVFLSISLIGLVPVYLCVRHFTRLRDPIEKGRAGTVALGYLAPTLVFLLTEIVGPRLSLNLPEVTTLGTFLGALIIWFGIWRYKLFILSPRTAAEDIVSMMADALLLVGMDGKVRQANRAASRLLGYGEEELIGRPVEILLPDSTRHRVRGAAFEAMTKSGPASDVETAFQAKDGRILPVSISTSVITDSRGTPQGVVLVGRDLIERKKAEEELRRFGDRLEELVEKRTGELDQVNRRLQQEITDHVRATGALAESEERFRSLFENSTIGL